MQRLIILRGAMASGKSTIAKKYRSFLNKTVWLKVDNFKDFFSPDSSPATLHFVNHAALVTLDYLLQGGFSIAMEGVFQNSYYIELAVKIAEKHNVACRVFQIKVPLEILKQRDKVREGIKEGCRKQLDEHEIERVYQVLEKNPYKDAIILDTTNLSIDACMQFIDNQFNPSL